MFNIKMNVFIVKILMYLQAVNIYYKDVINAEKNMNQLYYKNNISTYYIQSIHYKMKLEIFSLIDCPYSMKSEKLLKLYKPIIYKVSQDEKDKYKQENNMNTFPQIFLLNNQNKIKIGGYSDVKELLSKIFKNEKINLDNSEEIIKFFLNK